MIKGLKKFISATFVIPGALQAGAQQSLPSPYNSSAKVNYVRVWDATSPQTNPETLIVKPLKDVKQTTQYFDGLGRPLQTVIKQGSLITGSSAVDMVSPVLYDELGREQFKYSPFAANNTGGNNSISDGLFKLNPFQQDSTFNKAQFADESWYYSQTSFEASPLNRVLKTMAPGNNWVGASRGVEANYWINTATDSVRIWNVTDVINGFGTYASNQLFSAGTLYKNVTADENGKQVIEFKDKEGKVILKKVQLTAAADTGTGKGYYGWLCTFYLYDDLGQLRCVVQPRGVQLLIANGWSFTSDILNEQTFRYEYDSKQRMIMKRVPGAGIVYMVYDARDRLVMTQDSVMRANHKWLYTQYDTQNRPFATGLITDNNYYNDANYHRSHADTSIAYPNLGSYTAEELSKTFYDDYTWRPAENNPLNDTRSTTYDSYLQTASNTTWPYPQAITQSSQLKGMVTGTKTKVLGTSNTYLYSVNFYDEKARVVQAQSMNITAGTDIVTTQYGFTGQLLLLIAKNEKAGTNSQTSIALTQITYDDLGRVTKTEKKISNTKVNSGTMPSTWKTISQNEYDALGQLKKKKLGADPNNSSYPVDSLTYDYNIRGWVLGMNRSYVKDTTSITNWFGFDLGYDKTSFTINGSSNSYTDTQYNGNIAGMMWKSAGDDEIRKYDFTYDAVNRLTSADFNQYTSGSFDKEAGVDFSVAGLSYDANGNILYMNQRGWKLGGSITIDSLLYTYLSNSNKLKNVIDVVNDTTTKLGDFRSSTAYMNSLNNNKTTSATDYTYDANGNLNLDNNKDISSIHYNHLNLPDSIAVTNKGNIRYIYDAAGNKLKKITTEGNTVTTTIYLLGNYINDTLQFLGTEEGRVRPKDSTDLVYDYFIKDHLGNVRMVLTDEQKTDPYPAATMEDNSRVIENTFYSNIDATAVKITSIAGYPSDPSTNPNEYTAKVNGGNNKIGPAIVLKVMAGDKFNLHTSSWYSTYESPDYPYDPLNDLVSALASGIGALPGNGHPASNELINSGVLPPGITNFLTAQSNYNSDKPKAFINWILFDERFNYVPSSSGFEQVGDNDNLTMHTFSNLPINKNGYLYIYVSNETPNIDVFFDNLQVTHVRGPLVEETHYYPFGLTMAGISSKALNFGQPENKHKFNDGTELNSSLDISLYETDYRLYDPQIGRFVQIDEMADEFDEWSPYVFASDNPILLNDPLGLSSDTAWKPLPEVIVSVKLKKLDTENGQVLPPLPWYTYIFGQDRYWNGHYVNNAGYLSTKCIAFTVPDIGIKKVGAKQAAKIAIKYVGKKTGKYLVYRAYKQVTGRLLLYIGKAKNSLNYRYTAKEIEKIGAEVFDKLNDLPDNATALGVEQAILEINGGVNKVAGATSNIRNATINKVYKSEGIKWLNENIPDWKEVFKF